MRLQDRKVVPCYVADEFLRVFSLRHGEDTVNTYRVFRFDIQVFG